MCQCLYSLLFMPQYKKKKSSAVFVIISFFFMFTQVFFFVLIRRRHACACGHWSARFGQTWQDTRSTCRWSPPGSSLPQQRPLRCFQLRPLLRPLPLAWREPLLLLPAREQPSEPGWTWGLQRSRWHRPRRPRFQCCAGPCGAPAGSCGRTSSCRCSTRRTSLHGASACGHWVSSSGWSVCCRCCTGMLGCLYV